MIRLRVVLGNMKACTHLPFRRGSKTSNEGGLIEKSVYKVGLQCIVDLVRASW